MSAWEKVLIKCPKITITFRHIRKNIISNQSLRANLDKSVSGFYPKTSYGGVFGQTLSITDSDNLLYSFKINQL